MVHAEGFQDTVFDKLTDRSTVATFERELQQHIPRMCIDALLPRLLARLRRPCVEHIEKLLQRKRIVRPWRMIGRQQESGRMRCQLTDRHAFDVVAAQLRDIPARRIVQTEFATKRTQRDQDCLKRLA